MLGAILGGLAAGVGGSLLNNLMGGDEGMTGKPATETQVAPRTEEGQKLWDEFGYIDKINSLWAQPDMNVKMNGMEFPVMSPAVRQRGAFANALMMNPFLQLEGMRRLVPGSQATPGLVGQTAPGLGLLGGLLGPSGLQKLLGGDQSAVTGAVNAGTNPAGFSTPSSPNYMGGWGGDYGYSAVS